MKAIVNLILTFFMVLFTSAMIYGFADNYAVFNDSVDNVLQYPLGLCIACSSIVLIIATFITIVDVNSGE